MKLTKTIIIRALSREWRNVWSQTWVMREVKNSTTFLEGNMTVSSFKMFIHVDSTLALLGIFTGEKSELHKKLFKSLL